MFLKNQWPSFLLILIAAIAATVTRPTACAQPALSIRPLSDSVQLAFPAAAGVTNQIQWIDTIGHTNWTVLTNIVVSSNSVAAVLDHSVTNTFSRFYRLALLAPPSTNPVVLLDNLSGSSDGDGLFVDASQHAAIGFTLDATATGVWIFSTRIATGSDPTGATLAIQLLTNHVNTAAMMNEPGVSIPLPLPAPLFGSNFCTVSVNGTLAAGKYWLVASATSALDFYVWIDRGPYTSNGASLLGVRTDSSDGQGWQAVDTNGSFGHPLSLRIEFVPDP